MDAAAILASTPTADPFVEFLKWSVAIIVILLVGAKPLLSYIQQKNEMQADGSKDNAETILYNHLSEQVREYRELANKAVDERNTLLIRVTDLEHRVKEFSDMQQRFLAIQQRVEKKDEVITSLIAQGAEERARFMAIMETKDGQYARLESSYKELEARLSQDEARIGFAVCPLSSGDAPMIGCPETSPV